MTAAAAHAKSLAVVISDVHIGTNAPTNWYQRKVHEPYLVAALDWVVANANSVRELVLLGDLVDFWTYVPSARPPSLADIIAANPAVLGVKEDGSKGALGRVVAALPPGGVSLMLGNHDGTLDAADVATLSAAVGGDIRLVDPVHVLAGASGKRTVFSHGHLWTMFNAPDATTRFSPLPVGHFVTRIIAYKAVNSLLRPGQTVADLPLWGQPDPTLITQISALISGEPNLVSGVLLELFAQDAGFPENEPVTLPEGQTCTIAEAKAIYTPLVVQWILQWGEDAARAAMADYEGGSYLAWFAQRLALENDADLVVMGHTHQPVGGLTASPVTYINNGYECAASPDLAAGTASFTFTVVDLDEASATMHKVAPDRSGTYAITDFSAPLFPVVEPPLEDFSCYVRIKNQTDRPLTIGQLATPDHGRWVIEPPTIPVGGMGDMWLQDMLGIMGTAGAVTYNENLRFEFACPTGLFSNAASGPGDDFVAKSGANPWQAKGVVPAGDHPLRVEFAVTSADASPNFSGRCGQNSFATSGLGLQVGSALVLNGSTVLNDCIQANDGGCVYGITLSGGIFEGIYRYRLSIDGQGPSGLFSGSMYLAFTDRTGDVYRKSFFSSDRHVLTLDYNSRNPTIVRIQWSNTEI
jgi:UDP-2,3-diacylglucosamine pyrophosphatase LpxH